MGIIEIWNLLLLRPMLNVLIVLHKLLVENFGLAIIVFTILVRAITLPFTLKQLHSTKAITTLQPKLQELQKKYAKDKQKLAQEQMRLYKEMGVNPVGCLLPMLIQFPIWIGLYQSIMLALAATPEDLLGLAKHLYSWPMLYEVVPLKQHFLWLNLTQPDRTFLLPVLVAGSMWVQQKMITTATTDPRQASMNSMMQWMMPMMFGFFTLQFASGLAIFWVISNVIGIAIQYFVTGWGGLRFSFNLGGPRSALPETKGAREKKDVDGKLGNKR